MTALKLHSSELSIPNFPRGSIIELSGQRKLDILADFLRNRRLPVAWIEYNLNEVSPKLTHLDLDYDKILFINGGEDSSWATLAVLEVFPIVIFHAPLLSLTDMFQFQNIAKKHGATIIFLNDDPKCDSISFHVKVIRNGAVNKLSSCEI